MLDCSIDGNHRTVAAGALGSGTPLWSTALVHCTSPPLSVAPRPALAWVFEPDPVTATDHIALSFWGGDAAGGAAGWLERSGAACDPQPTLAARHTPSAAIGHAAYRMAPHSQAAVARLPSKVAQRCAERPALLPAALSVEHAEASGWHGARRRPSRWQQGDGGGGR